MVEIYSIVQKGMKKKKNVPMKATTQYLGEVSVRLSLGKVPQWPFRLFAEVKLVYHVRTLNNPLLSWCYCIDATYGSHTLQVI